MMHSIEPLDSAGYRRFGLVTGAIVAFLFGMAIPWLFSLEFPRWPWIFAGILAAWALLLPATLKPLYFGWMKFGHVMNWINTRIILGIIFYGLIVPFGLVMRLFGKDPMQRKLSSAVKTYRVDSQNPPRDNMENPY